MIKNSIISFISTLPKGPSKWWGSSINRPAWWNLMLKRWDKKNSYRIFYRTTSHRPLLTNSRLPMFFSTIAGTTTCPQSTWVMTLLEVRVPPKYYQKEVPQFRTRDKDLASSLKSSWNPFSQISTTRSMGMEPQLRWITHHRMQPKVSRK